MKAQYKIIQAVLLSVLVITSPAKAVNTVTFQGEVASQTCDVSINGNTNSIVMLPTVKLADLTGSAGKTAGLTPFTVSVSNCTASTTGDTAIKTKFLGHNVDSATGVLGNLASTNAATGVGIQLTQKSDGTTPVTLNGPTAVAGLVLKQGETSASYDFAAQYYALTAAPAAGAVTAVAEYTLSYL